MKENNKKLIWQKWLENLILIEKGINALKGLLFLLRKLIKFIPSIIGVELLKKIALADIMKILLMIIMYFKA